MKHSSEYRKFTSLVDQLLTVSHEEIKKREADYKRQVEENPKRRGPKRKRKVPTSPSADHEPNDLS